jgi:beta-lactamase regulating signal transducer with metallopeptidase domain
MTSELLLSLGNHLWQSTLFGGVVVLLALLLRKNGAAVRYRLWVIASVKFLLPFSLLIAVGRQVELPIRTQAPPAFITAVREFSQPFASEAVTPEPTLAPIPARPKIAAADRLPLLVLLVWLGGAALVGLRWLREWRRMRLALDAATPADVDFPIPVRMTELPTEPGVVGIVRPVLLLPQGLMERLTSEQVDSIIDHELCHVRRRDNLAAALHMVVETVFWFHPLVWWIEHRLVEERERACDEEVLHRGSEPQAYAEGILNVCKFYKESAQISKDESRTSWAIA